MHIPDFDTLKITTMTVIVNLSGNVEIDYVVPLLEITRLKLKTPIRQTRKFKIPFCATPGAILSVKYDGMTRGIVKSVTKTSFRNSVTIDICTSVKNISTKLSRNKIHMCGPNSKELALETAGHILTHLRNIQADLDYIHDNLDKRDATLEWIMKAVKGDEYIIDSETQDIVLLDIGEELEELEDSEDDSTQGIYRQRYRIKTADGTYRARIYDVKYEGWQPGDTVKDGRVLDADGNPYMVVVAGETEVMELGRNLFSDENNVNFKDAKGQIVRIRRSKIITVEKVFSLVYPKEYPNNYPEEVDTRIANFYIKHIPDYIYHDIYCLYLNSIKDIAKIMDTDVGIDRVDMAMINYSYHLQMNIVRGKLAEFINGYNDFTARFDNTSDHCVTITLPYDVPEHLKKIRRKNKTPCHTFMVYKSGIVTQSGPNIELMKEAYYKFMNTLSEISDLIAKKDQTFEIKYKRKKIQV